MACLVEDGYAATTTRRVAERAGVTPGALQHHFASRTALVTEALRTLTGQLVERFLEPAVEAGESERERAEALIDRLWEVFRGELFAAYLELWVAARTDGELAASLEAVTETMGLEILEGASYAFPDLIGQPGFAEAVVTGLATLRGLALQGFMPGADPDAFWPSTRRHLLILVDHVLAERS